ncbi:MAG: hypothetical protein COT15_00450 [Candidatus Diapherotrites archaeon CG08_land_8_20_14_0_20_34_12]|nr:MAG: hypothetical protein COT15_00450 [Candidatus Diapherotrites archaeon CG08_land_8_20_14_0_20_34_12]
MWTLDQLFFAYKYPISLKTREIIKDYNFSLDNLDKEIIDIAVSRIKSSYSGKEYLPSYIEHSKSKDLILTEIIAFPVAKILVSCLDRALMYKFSENVSSTLFYHLNREQKRLQVALDLANELGIKVDLKENGENYIELSLVDFVEVSNKDPQLNLVNQHVSAGKVLLNEIKFCRFLAAKAYFMTFNSLQGDLSSIPKYLKDIAKGIKFESAFSSNFESFGAFGKIDPNAFPACMKSIYSSLINGENVAHIARFNITTFLNSIGMPKEQIIAAFKKTPNFDERVTRYQVERITTGNIKYSASSCATMRSNGLCPDKNCTSKHPISFYKGALAVSRKTSKEEK